MPVSASRKTAAKTVRPRAVQAHAVRDVPVDDVPEELRGFYGDGPPKLSRARGGGTSDGYEPLALSTPTRAERAEVEMEPLFFIDDTEYGIPVTFPPSLALIYLDALDEGRDIAVARVLREAIGKPGWTALITFVRKGGAIGEQAMGAMMNRVLEKVMGVVNDMGEGNG